MSALTRRQLFGRVGMFGFGSWAAGSIVGRTAVLAPALPAAAWMITAGAVPDASVSKSGGA